MSFVEDGWQSVKGVFRQVFDVVRKRIFGANNERLDFVMDSFYKLSSKQQSAVVGAFFAALVVSVAMVFAVYFTQINTLENELNAGYEALKDIRSETKAYKIAQARIDWLKQNVESKTKTDDFKPKPHFEKLANRVGVSLEGLRSEETEVAKDSPLSSYFKEIQVSFRMPKVSIPRLLRFLSEVEKSGKNLTVRELRIRARYGDRLFFDVEALVSGYKTI